MKNIRLDRIKKKGFSQNFHFNVFLPNISSKILKHLTKDTEFRDILQISAKQFSYFLVFESSPSKCLSSKFCVDKIKLKIAS